MPHFIYDNQEKWKNVRAGNENGIGCLLKKEIGREKTGAISVEYLEDER